MAVRLTRQSVTVAIQIPVAVRLTRLSAQVAIGEQTDDNLRGIRRAGIIHHRSPQRIPRA